MKKTMMQRWFIFLRLSEGRKGSGTCDDERKEKDGDVVMKMEKASKHCFEIIYMRCYFVCLCLVIVLCLQIFDK